MKQPSFNHRLLLTAMTSAVALLQSAGTASAVVPTGYDLTAEWSDTQNPNGVWSYNHNTSPITTYQMFSIGVAGWGYNHLADGAILRALPAGTVHDWLPGDVMMHALSEPYGGLSTFVNVTWTSPGAGIIDISGRAWDGAIQSDRDMSWTLFVGGQAIAQRSSVQDLYRTDVGALFGSNLIGGNTLTGIPVAQGDIVEFRILATSYYGHFMGVQETITFVPEAGASQILAAGLIGMWLFRKYSPKTGAVRATTA